MAFAPVVRIEEAGLGQNAQVRLVLSGVPNVDRLLRPWSSSGASLQHSGDRVRAITTVEALARAAGRSLGPGPGGEITVAVREAVAAWVGDTPDMELPGGHLLAGAHRTLVMGVVNVTPDSFSDGGALFPDGHPDTAVAHGQRLAMEGADVLDVGGESTRPGAQPVSLEEELARVVPVVKALSSTGQPVSIDTTKPEVASAALDAGAVIVNDVSGASDQALLAAVAERGAVYVLMHVRGTPRDMAQRTDYADVVAEVYEFLAEGLARCETAGIDRAQIIVDPGIGFAKDASQNLELMAELRQFRGLGRPVLLGASRKSFLGAVAGSQDPGERLESSLACAVVAATARVAMVRAHDVAPTVRAVRITDAITQARPAWAT